MVFIQHDSYNDLVYLTLRSNEYSTAVNSIKSHLLFELYRPIVVSNNIDMYMNVESFKFTNSMYNINQYNNVFYYGIAPSYTLTSIIIPTGNYNITSLIDHLNSNIGNNFTFTYVESLFKVTITNTAEFKLFNNDDNILKVLGFNNTTHTSTALSLTSENMINLLGTQVIYIYITNLSFTSYSIKGSSQVNTVLTVPITAVQGDSQSVTTSHRHKLAETVINSVEVVIKDENDNEIDFNGVDWFLSLNFIFAYKKHYVAPSMLNDVIAESNQNEEEKENISV